MITLKQLFESKNIIISLRSFDPQDLVTGWEVKYIVDNPDVFNDFYSHHPLTEILTLDDYYLFLLSLK